MSSKDYDVIIERGHSVVNDMIFDYLLPKLKGKVLDIGCNTGVLLQEYKGEIEGCDYSPLLVAYCQDKKLKVIQADATDLPYKDNEFDCAVLSCVLEQVEDWEKALKEALRVARRVVGVCNYPESPWGRNSHSPWVKSVTEPRYMKDKYKAKIEELSGWHFYFEI